MIDASDAQSHPHRAAATACEHQHWRDRGAIAQFGVAHFYATEILTIRLWLPALSQRQLDRLPKDIADAYRTRGTMVVPA